MSVLSKLKAVVSGSPVVHIVIAAFVGAVASVVAPYILTGTLTVGVAKLAAYAGVSAALRALVLLVPAKPAPVPVDPAAAVPVGDAPAGTR